MHQSRPFCPGVVKWSTVSQDKFQITDKFILGGNPEKAVILVQKYMSNEPLTNSF